MLINLQSLFIQLQLQVNVAQEEVLHPVIGEGQGQELLRQSKECQQRGLQQLNISRLLTMC